jgi:hypothetical protein
MPNLWFRNIEAEDIDGVGDDAFGGEGEMPDNGVENVGDDPYDELKALVSLWLKKCMTSGNVQATQTEDVEAIEIDGVGNDAFGGEGEMPHNGVPRFGDSLYDELKRLYDVDQARSMSKYIQPVVCVVQELKASGLVLAVTSGQGGSLPRKAAMFYGHDVVDFRPRYRCEVIDQTPEVIEITAAWPLIKDAVPGEHVIIGQSSATTDLTQFARIIEKLYLHPAGSPAYGLCPILEPTMFNAPANGHPDESLTEEQGIAYMRLMYPGWHGLVGGPGCGKTTLLGDVGKAYLASGFVVILLAQNNRTALELYAKVVSGADGFMIVNKDEVIAFGLPTQDEIDLTLKLNPKLRNPADYMAPFKTWTNKKPGSTQYVPKACRVVVSTIGGLTSGKKSIDALKAHCYDNRLKTVVIIEEASQVNPLAALGLIMNPEFRSNCIFAGDNLQVGRAIWSETKYAMTTSDESLMDFVSHPDRQDFRAFKMFLQHHGINTTWSRLMLTHRLHPFAARFGSRIYGEEDGMRFRSIIRDVGQPRDQQFLHYICDTQAMPIERFKGSSRVNPLEILCVEHILRGINDLDKVVVLTPYVGHEESLTQYLNSVGLYVKCATINKFNGSECDIVIATMAGGLDYLDQVTIINSITSRHKKMLYMVTSSNYSLLPRHHSLEAFLRCYRDHPNLVRRFTVDPEAFDSHPVCTDVCGSFERASAALSTTAPGEALTPEERAAEVEKSRIFVDLKGEVDVRITVFLGVQPYAIAGAGYAVAVGSIHVHLSGSEVDIQDHVFDYSTVAEHPKSLPEFLCRVATIQVYLNQLMTIMTNLIPFAPYIDSGRFRPRCNVKSISVAVKAFGRTIDYFEKDVLVNGLKSLQLLARTNHPKLTGTKPMKMTIEFGRPWTERMATLLLKTYGKVIAGDLAEILGKVRAMEPLASVRDPVMHCTSEAAVALFKHSSSPILMATVSEMIHVFDSDKNGGSLGQSMYMNHTSSGSEAGKRSFSWLHNSVKSFHIGTAFGCELSASLFGSDIDTVKFCNSNVQLVLNSCFSAAATLWDYHFDHHHGIEFRLLMSLTGIMKRGILAFGALNERVAEHRPLVSVLFDQFQCICRWIIRPASCEPILLPDIETAKDYWVFDLKDYRPADDEASNYRARLNRTIHFTEKFSERGLDGLALPDDSEITGQMLDVLSALVPDRRPDGRSYMQWLCLADTEEHPLSHRRFVFVPLQGRFAERTIKRAIWDVPRRPLAFGIWTDPEKSFMDRGVQSGYSRLIFLVDGGENGIRELLKDLAPLQDSDTGKNMFNTQLYNVSCRLCQVIELAGLHEYFDGVNAKTYLYSLSNEHPPADLFVPLAKREIASGLKNFACKCKRNSKVKYKAPARWDQGWK